MNLKYIISVLSFVVIIAAWYEHHVGYNEGHEASVLDSLTRVKHDNDVLSTKVLELTTQIKEQTKIINAHDVDMKNNTIKSNSIKTSMNDVFKKHDDWSTSVVPDDIANELRRASNNNNTSTDNKTTSSGSK